LALRENTLEISKIFLSGAYLPSHEKNLMRHEGDVELARRNFLQNRPSNLAYLLTTRFSWMEPYSNGAKEIVEIGSGHGLIKEFLKNPNLKLSDVVKRPWTDLEVDALQTPFADGSVDVLIASHMIHHLAQPSRFFGEMARILRPNGLLLIVDINTSLFMRLILRIMRHEGWSYDVDVFDPNCIANDPRDPWSANCAIPELLFRKGQRFESAIPEFEIVRNELCECLLMPLSGGVVAKTKTINLPTLVLKGIEKLDRILVRLMPDAFAFGRRVVLKRK
jgi:SAM-dependent methyltransferase